MLRNLFEYVIGLGEKQAKLEDKIVLIDGVEYTTENLERVPGVPGPETVFVSSLQTIVDYIKNNPDGVNIDDLIIHVVSPTKVILMSNLMDDNTRDYYLEANAILLHIYLNNFLDIDQFNTQLQSCFVQTDNTAEILRITGNISDETVKTVGDDGVKQQVVVKKGVHLKDEATIPNPVRVAPYRTFSEVNQPESKFVLRLEEGPTVALMEADGGAWKVEAMYNIKKFFQINLWDGEKCKINILG